MIDVVCYYADLGRPYRPLMERMCASAKKHIDCATVILTPTPAPWMTGVFDRVAGYTSQSYPTVTRENLCQQRAEGMTAWGGRCERLTFFVDPDIEFRNTPAIPDCDVALLWRADRFSMPVNTGFISTKPGQERFWMQYGNTVLNLPPRIHGWWCDQIGFSILLGNSHAAGDTLDLHGAKIHLLDTFDNCASPKKATEKAWAIHYQGHSKGPEWKPIFKSEVFKDDRLGLELSHLREVA